MEVHRVYRHRTLEERLETYLKVRDLRATGLDLRGISQALAIRRRDVSYWLRVKRPSRTVYNPDLNPRPELAYLVGAYLGDGRTAGPNDKKVRCKVADLGFATLLNELVANTLQTGTKALAREQGLYCVNYDSAVLYDYLQKPLEELMTLADFSWSSFLRGVFDSEGYVSPILNRTRKKFLGVTVGITNTSDEYLDYARRLLDRLGISCELFLTHKAGEPMTIRGETFPRRRDVRQLRIRGRTNVLAFMQNVGFAIPSKSRKLTDLVWVNSNLDASDGYDWFVSRYRLQNRRWVRRASLVSKMQHSFY